MTRDFLTIALTGNVAAGKSTVAALFRGWGAFVTDADAIVRELQRPGTPVFQAMRARFGPDIVRPDGVLDRAALRRLVLADPAALADLNAIVHPAVQARRAALEAEAARSGHTRIVHDIPLLFEAADPEAFDYVVLVDAPEPIRRDRLLARGLGREEAERLMAAQMPSDAKRPRSDFVVVNQGSLEELERRARVVWQAIRDEP